MGTKRSGISAFPSQIMWCYVLKAWILIWPHWSVGETIFVSIFFWIIAIFSRLSHCFSVTSCKSVQGEQYPCEGVCKIYQRQLPRHPFVIAMGSSQGHDRYRRRNPRTSCICQRLEPCFHSCRTPSIPYAGQGKGERKILIKWSFIVAWTELIVICCSIN